jgi:hypothetical protein
MRARLALLVSTCLACGDDATVTDARGPDGGSTDAARDAGAGSDASRDSGADAGAPLPDYPDLAIGPYERTLPILIDSLRADAAAYDTSATYSHSAAQGYVLQAIAILLDDSLGALLPGGEATRDELAALALDEIDELRASSDRVAGGGPAFGLDEAWDAFGDGSTNPAFTAYTWQSGMVALGAALLVRYFERAGDRHAALADRVAMLRDFAEALVSYWHTRFTDLGELGWYWYSDRSSDDIAVHNTSALVAMASQVLSESGSDSSFGERPPKTAALLHARLLGGSSPYWNYADDGYPAGLRTPEDVSHALITLQLMRFARERDWWSDADMARIASTLLGRVWTGNPLRLHGRVDGSSGGENEWTWTRAATIGWAAHGDSPGGDPAIFDYARSLYFSTILGAEPVAMDGGTVDAVGVLALARLFAARPDAFASGWVRVAGDGDMTPTLEGARFYTVDWDAPRDVTVGGLALVARANTELDANFLVDLPEADTRDIVVSIVWQSGTAGAIQQWDGTVYQPVTVLPPTIDASGTVRWARTSFRMRADRFDYEAHPGLNVLFQVTNRIALHRIEVTPL